MMQTLSTNVPYIFPKTRHTLSLITQVRSDITHLKHDERGIVQLEEREGGGNPHALDGQWRLQSDVE